MNRVVKAVAQVVSSPFFNELEAPVTDEAILIERWKAA